MNPVSSIQKVQTKEKIIQIFDFHNNQFLKEWKGYK